jgi:ribonuclease G
VAGQEGFVASWFRRTLLREAEAAEQAPAPDAREEEQETKEAPPEPEGSETAPRPRRRGTRGGAGRRKAASSAADDEASPVEAAAKAPAQTKRRTAAKTGDSKAAGKVPAARKTSAAKPAAAKPEGPKRRRRSETARRSSLPAVSKRMLVSIDVGEQRVAVLEDGQVVEVYLERPGRRSIAGNIYKGLVDNVLPGMEASFVDIGLEKNGFLYVDEIVVPELEGKRHARRIQDIISRGQDVLVQATKDPMGTKGARLTTEVSLPGRFLVYTPYGDGIGVSRRLEDAERERLKGICKTLELPEGGIIVRTAAEGASETELAGDLAFLQKLWSTVLGRASRAGAPSLVYREAELPLRVVRDLFTADFEGLAIDHERTYHRIVSYLKRTSPELASNVELYRGADRLMETSGVDAAVRSTLERRVDLPSGGYLVFDYAEAFTVIDVNTGRFVGARGKASGARLEDTITKNNLEAAKEIVRQLRLRDIGGIIVIDFIDMANPKNRQEVEEALRLELERDRTKTYVVEISPLGLVEMTRQNVTDGPREILTTRCPVCEGNGIVVSEETSAVDAERKLRRLGAASSAEAFLVELSSGVAGILIGPAGTRLVELERETGKLFAFETRDDLPSDHLKVLREGTAAEIEPQALPVQAGQELELVLAERHLRHPDDAIARLDGYIVSVAGAGSRVGETVLARIERATRTAAYAVLAAPVETEAPVDAGALAEDAEAEARAPARPKARRASGGGPRRAKPAEAAPAAGSEEAEVEAPEPVAETEPGADGEAPKKKTRRGTRGGRGRKKPAEVSPDASEPEVEDGPSPAPEAEGDSAPSRELSLEGPEARVDGEPPKKKTRRGTRGGRGRKKPAAGVAGAGVGDDDGADASAVAELPSAEVPAEGETREEAESPQGGATPKQGTRRGTRGGRGRKKPAAGVAAAGVGDGDGADASAVAELPSAEVPAEGETREEAEPPQGAATPKQGTRGGRGRQTTGQAKASSAPETAAEPVEAPDGTGDEVSEAPEVAPPKKRTRRGSRGGRGRRRPSGASTGSGPGEAVDGGPEAGASGEAETVAASTSG